MSPSPDLSCQELVELVTEYLEGALPARERARLESHLRGCGACAGYLDQMRHTIRVSGRLSPDDITSAQHDALIDVFRRWKAG